MSTDLSEAITAPTARTQDDIVNRLESRKDDDRLGFEVSAYIDYLGFEHARPYLNPGVTAEEWDVVFIGIDPKKHGAY